LAAWLGEVPATEAELLALLRPRADELTKICPVNKAVGDVKFQSDWCRAVAPTSRPAPVWGPVHRLRGFPFCDGNLIRCNKESSRCPDARRRRLSSLAFAGRIARSRDCWFSFAGANAGGFFVRAVAGARKDLTNRTGGSHNPLSPCYRAPPPSSFG
jgi:hypothetical protein